MFHSRYHLNIASNRIKRVCLFPLACLTLVACNFNSENSDKTKYADPYTITFVTINSPTTYYINSEKKFAGIEYDLAQLFVKNLGAAYQAKFLVVNNISEVIPALNAGKADVAAANLTVTDARKKYVNFSKSYLTTQQEVLFNEAFNKAPASTMNGLLGTLIAVPSGTSFAERLHNFKKDYPTLKWQERNVGSERLIELLANGELDYTIADSQLAALMHNLYPNLGIAMPLGEPEQLAWAVSKKKTPLDPSIKSVKSDLINSINTFISKTEKDGSLRNIIDRYLGQTKRLGDVDVKAFLSRSRTTLPQYISLFKSAQEITDIDWRLLAAMSYQESHWDAFSTSPTNVRGLMMLTESTADLMGVTDRLDPKQSIFAGAKYLSDLKDKTIPNRIQEPDRTYMALAAYNIGYAHVEDARVLAQRLKLNPDSWADIKKTLVLLNNPEFYTKAKYGYASGGAPVIYVESIRNYQRILEHYQPSHEPSNKFKIAGN